MSFYQSYVAYLIDNGMVMQQVSPPMVGVNMPPTSQGGVNMVHGGNMPLPQSQSVNMGMTSQVRLQIVSLSDIGYFVYTLHKVATFREWLTDIFPSQCILCSRFSVNIIILIHLSDFCRRNRYTNHCDFSLSQKRWKKTTQFYSAMFKHISHHAKHESRLVAIYLLRGTCTLANLIF